MNPSPPSGAGSRQENGDSQDSNGNASGLFPNQESGGCESRGFHQGPVRVTEGSDIPSIPAAQSAGFYNQKMGSYALVYGGNCSSAPRGLPDQPSKGVEETRESIHPQRPGGTTEIGAVPSPPIPAGTFSVSMSYIAIIVKLGEMDALTFWEIERQTLKDERLSDFERKTVIIPLLDARWRYLAQQVR